MEILSLLHISKYIAVLYSLKHKHIMSLSIDNIFRHDYDTLFSQVECWPFEKNIL